MRDKRGNPTIILLALLAVFGLLYVGFFNHGSSGEKTTGDAVPVEETPVDESSEISPDVSEGDNANSNIPPEKADNGSSALDTASASVNSSKSEDAGESPTSSIDADDSSVSAKPATPVETASRNDEVPEPEIPNPNHGGYYDTSVYGIHYYVPDGFVYVEPPDLPAAGRHYLLYNSSLDMSIDIWEMWSFQLPEGVTFADDIEDAYNYALEDESVTYKRKGENWCVISGYDEDGMIFYDKIIIIGDDLEGWCNIRYSPDNQELCNPVVERFEDSFRPSNKAH